MTVGLKEHFIEDCLVVCLFENVDDNGVWVLAGVYNPNIDSYRRLLWDEIVGVYRLWNVHWCFDGDFNVNRFPNEHSRDTHYTNAMLELSDLIFFSLI